MKPTYTIQITLGTFGAVTENLLLEIIREGLVKANHYKPDVNVTQISYEYNPPAETYEEECMRFLGAFTSREVRDEDKS